MQSTVKATIRDAALSVHSRPLAEFIQATPAQVALLGLQLLWTADVHEALSNASRDRGALVKAQRRAEAALREMVSMTLDATLTPLQRTSLETCITVYMHQKESTDELVKAKVGDVVMTP